MYVPAADRLLVSLCKRAVCYLAFVNGKQGPVAAAAGLIELAAVCCKLFVLLHSRSADS